MYALSKQAPGKSNILPSLDCYKVISTHVYKFFNTFYKPNFNFESYSNFVSFGIRAK
jgi:hypothetical protein